MQKDISFVDLLKETSDLIRDYRPFSRGAISRNISTVILRSLIDSMPKVLSDFNFQQHELLFICTLIVEPDVCRDVIKQFARFWAGTHSGALYIQMQLELSIAERGLKPYVEDDGTHRIRIKPDVRMRLLSALVANELFDDSRKD